MKAFIPSRRNSNTFSVLMRPSFMKHPLTGSEICVSISETLCGNHHNQSLSQSQNLTWMDNEEIANIRKWKLFGRGTDLAKEDCRINMAKPKFVSFQKVQRLYDCVDTKINELLIQKKESVTLCLFKLWKNKNRS